MKRALFQLFNLLMACVVLTSSTGFGLVEHSCQMRGKKVYLSQKQADCMGCASDKQVIPTDAPTIKATNCCKNEAKYENVDVTSSLSQLAAKALKAVTDVMLTGVTAVVMWLVETFFASHSASSVSVHAPPLPAGRLLLALIQSLLI